MRTILSSTAIVMLAALNAHSQQVDDSFLDRGIRLFPGYKHTRTVSRDTATGTIHKRNGLKFHYDIGELSGNYVNYRIGDEDLLWHKLNYINGVPIQLALTEDKMFYISRSTLGANFYGKISSEEEMADILLIALSYPAKSHSK